MLTFSDLHQRLLEHLRSRVRNGEMTERRLAKLTGISQPHIHNVLKGTRGLTSEVGDEILRTFHLSLNDLIGATDVGHPVPSTRDGMRYISVLDGLIGPHHPWPMRMSTTERYGISESRACGLVNPVAARIAEDVRMGALFSNNDIGVLDQGFSARSEIDPDGLYLVNIGGHGLVRRIRSTFSAIYVVTEDCLHLPIAWTRVSVASAPVEQIVRARVLFDVTDNQWERQVA